ncbi:MAG: hypothetical protein PVJ57_06995 [Phycisphaerae bacterium]|jgi:hypothetical protein
MPKAVRAWLDSHGDTPIDQDTRAPAEVLGWLVKSIVNPDWRKMNEYDYSYETRMGEWVAARCRKRAEEHGKAMPDRVKEWLDTGGNSPVNQDTPPPPDILGWVIKSIEDPDWLERPV